VLISLSVGSILTYIVWICYRVNRIKFATLVTLSVLVTFLGSTLCYALSTVPAGKDYVGCEAISALYQFFFLSSIAWTNSLAGDITVTIFSYRVQSKPLKRYFKFAVYGFGFPLLLTLITVLLSEGQKAERILVFAERVYRQEDICFLQEVIIVYSMFLGPIYFLILVNIILCVLAIQKIMRSGNISNSDKNKFKKKIISCFKLSLCLGLGWIFLFGALVMPSLWPALQIFVESQGMLVVLGDIINWNCINRLGSTVSSRFSTTNSSTMTKASTKTTGSTGSNSQRSQKPQVST